MSKGKTVVTGLENIAELLKGNPNFSRWFNGSKIVDQAGAPVPVYHHGTFDETADIPNEFMHFGTENAALTRAVGKQKEWEAENLQTYQGDDGLWHWEAADGTTSEDLGLGYKSKEFAQESGTNTVMEWVDQNPDFDPANYGNMTQAYLSIKNPKRLNDLGGLNGEWGPAASQAMAEGHDGIVYRNQYEDKGSDSYIAFDPRQIKSVNNQGTFDPSNPNILKTAAPYLMGGAALAAATAPEDAEAGIITKGGKRLIEAWHGSPHTFDKFDISKIGTGEGAQVYGHGLYFADAKETADSYKGMGRPKNLNYKPEMNGVRVTGHLQNGSPFDLGRFGSMEDAQRAGDQLDGSLYRTHIDVNPDTLLDWDKPLSEQSDQVKNLIEPFKQRRLEVMNQRPGIYTSPPETIVNNMTGGEWLDEMTGQIAATSSDPAAIGRGAQAHTSKFLHENGIPGIRYLDGMSRDGGEGTYNYVMFDDKPISIVERGNASPEMLGTLGAGTAAVMAVTQDYDNRRAQKADYWRGIRQSVIDLANSVSDFTSNTAFPALDKPLQGYMGLAGTAGSLMAGNSFPDAIQQGAMIAQQPTDQTAYQYGQTVTDALTPYTPAPVAAGAGALTNAGILMTSPF